MIKLSNINKFLNKIKEIFSYCSIKNGIVNYYKYSKIIWNDRDFDSVYLIELTIFKLEKQKKYFQENGITTDNNRMIKQISILSEHLKRLSEESYFFPHYDYDIPLEIANKNHSLLKRLEEKYKNSPDIIKRINKYRTIEIYNRTHSKTQEQYHLNEVSKIIRKYLLTWWD